MSQRVRLGGADLHLDPSGALVDPARGRLFVADLHLGKGATLRAAGLPVPAGTSRETMRRVTGAMARAEGGIRELWVLGDLIHAASGLDTSLVREVSAWITSLPGGALHLVRGNHDGGAGALPAEWNLVEYPDPHWLEEYQVAHVPPGPDAIGVRDGDRPVIAGHLHPMVRLLRGRTRSPKVPAFVGWDGTRSAPGVLVLPAQGRLVDGAVIRGRPGMVAWACTADGVAPVPAGAW
jgi:DNA ligase-associated metallophosphoesterase